MRAVPPEANRPIGNCRGGALVFVLLAVALFSVLGLGLAAATVGDHSAAHRSLGETKARYAAEAGVAHAVAEIRARYEAGKLLLEPDFNGAGDLEEGLAYSYAVEEITANTFKVTSGGGYRDFAASVEAEVELLPEAAGYAIFCDGDLDLVDVAEMTVRGNIHSNGHIRAGTVTDPLLDNFTLDGEAYAVDREDSRLPPGYEVRQGEEIPMPEVDWERIRQNAEEPYPPPLDLPGLSVWVLPHLDGEVVYFDKDALLIGPLVGRGVIAVDGTAVVLLSGENSSPTDEGVMLTARDDVYFVLNVMDLGNDLKTVLGVVGGLLDLPDLEPDRDDLDYYLIGLFYAGDEIMSVGGVLTIHGSVIARNLCGLDVASLFVHDPDLAKKLPAGKVYFEGCPVRITRWEES